MTEGSGEATGGQQHSWSGVRPLFRADTIAARVQELGEEVRRYYESAANADLLLVSVLTGSFVFMADLVRAIQRPLDIDFMSVSSYGAGTKSTGVVRILKDLDRSVEGRHVLLVEDIVDTGRTLSHLMDVLETRHPASIEICTLLDKPAARVASVKARFVGFPCPDAFVVGYGLDLDGRYRNLPFIGEYQPGISR